MKEMGTKLEDDNDLVEIILWYLCCMSSQYIVFKKATGQIRQLIDEIHSSDMDP